MSDMTRKTGEGTFSIGTASKFGGISIKIDLNDMDKTLEMIKKAQDLSTKLSNLQEMRNLY